VGPIKTLKIIRRANKLLVRAKTINAGQNLAAQILALIVYAVALFGEFLPGEWRAIAVASGALIQVIAGMLAQYSNPDGGDITEPYVEPK
jgi:hypothetical protein